MSGSYYKALTQEYLQQEVNYKIQVTLDDKHHGFLTPKPFEYFVMPFYSFKTLGLAGFGKLSYNIAPYDKFLN